MSVQVATDFLHSTPLPRRACWKCCRALLAQELHIKRTIGFRHLPATSSRFTARLHHTAQKPLCRVFTTSTPVSVASDRLRIPGKKAIGPGRNASLVPTPASSELQEAEGLVSAITESDTAVPSDEEITRALEACEAAARSLTYSPSRSGPSATASLLSLHSQPAGNSNALVVRLSELTYELIRHPTVFISPKALSSYVSIQSLLQRPSTFPEVFKLYAQKPIPHVSGNGVVSYKAPNSSKASSAVDPEVANTALSVAILKKDLFAALDTIDITFSTTAHQRAKFLRKALPSVAGFAMAPFAAYALASRFSEWQDTMEPSTATGVAAAGIMTYFGVIGTMAYVAVTTANDQMERVTWASGTPLYLRWLREEERAAIDKVACAWGLKDLWKRGEEEGEEWEFLREWIGYRGMVLDKTELMDGME